MNDYYDDEDHLLEVDDSVIDYSKLDLVFNKLDLSFDELSSASNHSKEKFLNALAQARGYFDEIQIAYALNKFSHSEGNLLKPSKYTAMNELSVLHLCLISVENFNELSSHLRASDFLDIKNELLFESITNIYALSNSYSLDINRLMLEINNQPDIGNQNRLDAVGGFAYLSKIYNLNTNFQNLKTYVQEIKKQKARRVLHSITLETFNTLNQANLDLVKFIGDVQYRLSKINLDDAHRLISEMRIDSVFNLALRNHYNEEKTVVSTGFINLDRMLHGLRAQNLTIIAGRPAMGKSTFAMNICENIAFESNSNPEDQKPVIIFSLEMPGEQLALRLLSSMGNIRQNDIQNRIVNSEITDAIKSVTELLRKDHHLFINDSFGITIELIRSVVRSIANEYDGKVGLVMVDYLQLVRTSRKFDSRHLEIAEITFSLKNIAREFDCPVIALSQLNRNVDSRGKDARPNNSDLRESGSIEQDADVVIMVHRPEVYATTDVEKDKNKNLAEAIITKNRHGEIGKVNLRFEGEYSRFVDVINTN